MVSHNLQADLGIWEVLIPLGAPSPRHGEGT
jgi:hypothetical protein